MNLFGPKDCKSRQVYEIRVDFLELGKPKKTSCQPAKGLTTLMLVEITTMIVCSQSKQKHHAGKH